MKLREFRFTPKTWRSHGERKLQFVFEFAPGYFRAQLWGKREEQ